jgi:DNA adenine methylase
MHEKNERTRAQSGSYPAPSGMSDNLDSDGNADSQEQALALNMVYDKSHSSIFKSPLRYPGGKQRAIAQIACMFPDGAREYREPMVGGGSVYLHARSNQFAQKYWINDKFAELTAFWRCVQDADACLSLIKELSELKKSLVRSADYKQYFLNARKENPDDGFRQAFLFFFFNRVTFSGTTRAGGFSSQASLRRFTASSIARLEPMPSALLDTKITNCDFEQLIEAPGRDVFIFLDPPYYTATRLYGHKGALHDFDHERLAACLKATRHKFLITYDDCPQIRSLYRFAKVKKWQLQYGMNNCNSARQSKLGNEIFICNY